MAGNYYFVSALPSLGDLGSAPPMTVAELRQHVSGSRRALAMVDAILLGSDLLERESFLAGETQDVAPAVLTPAQVRNEEPLPAHLATDDEPAGRGMASDAVWAAYFHWAAKTAAATGSAFLAGWVGHEVALRNALVTARAKALDLDPADYVVTPELAEADDDLAPLVAEWAAAASPLEGLRILDRGRREWLAGHEAWFSFADEELAAYAAKLMLVIRWHRLAHAHENT